MALKLSLYAFGCLIDGFRSRELRRQAAALLGVGLQQYSASQMSYDLRRLLRKGIICRVAGSQRCYLTPYGWRLARFYARLEARVFRPGTHSHERTTNCIECHIKQSAANDRSRTGSIL
jgi:hypothetical protein